MSAARLRIAFPIAVVCAFLLPGSGTAQTQQAGSRQSEFTKTGVMQPPGYTPTNSGSTTNATPAQASHADMGASNWSAGRGSFGTAGSMPSAAKGTERGAASGAAVHAAASGSGHSSWVAGQGSFGSKTQPDGIWRDRAGIPRTTGQTFASHQSGASKAFPVSPGFTGMKPAFTAQPFGAPPAHAAFVQPSARANAGGLHFGASNGMSQRLPMRNIGRASTKASSAGSRSRTNFQSRGRSAIGTESKSSRSVPTTQSPTIFAPFGGKPEGNASGKADADGEPPLQP